MKKLFYFSALFSVLFLSSGQNLFGMHSRGPEQKAGACRKIFDYSSLLPKPELLNKMLKCLKKKGELYKSYATTFDKLKVWTEEQLSSQASLLFFDLDQTIIDTSPLYKALRNLLTKMYKEKNENLYWNLLTLAIRTRTTLLVDEGFPPWIKKLQKEGYNPIGLTAAKTGKFWEIDEIGKDKIKKLERLGIDFTDNKLLEGIEKEELTAPDGQKFKIDHGIGFAGDIIDEKGMGVPSYIITQGQKTEVIVTQEDEPKSQKTSENNAPNFTLVKKTCEENATRFILLKKKGIVFYTLMKEIIKSGALKDYEGKDGGIKIVFINDNKEFLSDIDKAVDALNDHCKRQEKGLEFKFCGIQFLKARLLDLYLVNEYGQCYGFNTEQVEEILKNLNKGFQDIKQIGKLNGKEKIFNFF